MGAERGHKAGVSFHPRGYTIHEIVLNESLVEGLFFKLTAVANGR